MFAFLRQNIYHVSGVEYLFTLVFIFSIYTGLFKLLKQLQYDS